jgi:hypothetical protein
LLARQAAANSCGNVTGNTSMTIVQFQAKSQEAPGRKDPISSSTTSPANSGPARALCQAFGRAHGRDVRKTGPCSRIEGVPDVVRWLSLTCPGDRRGPGEDTDDKEHAMTSGEFSAWRKASYSTGNSECVEVATGRRTWRKASYSTGNSDCVEVGADRRVVGIRDTRQLGRGPVLEFPAAVWQSFIGTTKAGRA